MSVKQLADQHYRRQVQLAQRAATRITGMWRSVSPADIAATWREQLGRAFTVVSSAQAIAAASSGVYVGDVVAEQGLRPDTEGQVNPAAFSEIASDGRDLTSLLYQPAITALRAIAAGATVPRALAAGTVELDMIVRTQVADAGRVADGVAVVARPQVTGYVRMLELPSCSRCIVLAGRVYEWNDGFQRHPNCDCRHIPAAEDLAGEVRTDPRQAFDAMTPAEQDRIFTRAGAEAIRDGADIGKVVNARRGMYTAGGRKFTTEAAGRRQRLMPEQILIEADGDRAEAIRLLRLHRYLT